MTLPIQICVQENKCYLRTVKITGKVSSDQTCRFPNFSSRSTKYIVPFSLPRPKPNRLSTNFRQNRRYMDTSMSRDQIRKCTSWTTNAPILSKNTYTKTILIFSSSCPTSIARMRQKRPLSRSNITFFPECAVSIPTFSYIFWCCLIPFSTTTLNILRPLWINPNISDGALLNGAFDYNKTPLAPPGTKVLLHETPERRSTWAPHGIDSWYISAAPKYYHYHCFFVSRTPKERITRTVDLFPHCFSCQPPCPMPPPSSLHFLPSNWTKPQPYPLFQKTLFVTCSPLRTHTPYYLRGCAHHRFLPSYL